MRQDGQDGKKNRKKSTDQIKDQNTKNQKTKIWDERNISDRKSSNYKAAGSLILKLVIVFCIVIFSTMLN